MKRMKKVPGVRYLYKDQGGRFYERIQTKDENTYVCLKMTRQAQAEKCLEANRLQRYAERQGLEVEKPKKKAVTVADVLDFYEKSGCPDKRGRLRYNPTTNTPAAYRELPYLSTLKEGFAGKTVNELRPKNLDAYHTWRCLELQAKVGPSAGEQEELNRGHRTTDLELNTLNSALKWAVRQEMIPVNPIAIRSRYYSAKEARHAREVAPSSIEEVHEVAGILFSSKRSETLGWQWLFECHTGLRPRLHANEREWRRSSLTKALDRGRSCIVMLP